MRVGVGVGVCPHVFVCKQVSKKSHSLSTKELHAQQGEYHDEKEQEKEQTDNGFHRVQQRHHQVPQRGPVPETHRPSRVKHSSWFGFSMFEHHSNQCN